MTALLTYLFLALSVSFVCSLLESVLLSVTHAHIAVLKREGKRSSDILRDLKRNINHPLAAILTLNTVANTVGAAGVGAQAFLLFGSEWVAYFSAALTVMILVFSEIIPKTLGAVFWKRLSSPAAYALKGMIIVLYPVVAVLEKISSFISRRGQSAKVTRDELLVLADIGHTDGILSKNEATILRNLLLMTELRAEDIMTPRSVVLAFDKESTVGEVIDDNGTLRFSRIPVYDDTMDNITGIILKAELMESYYNGQRDIAVGDIAKPVFAVPESRTISGLFDDFFNRGEHIFIVVDEYGGVAGIVTLEDAVETLLGVEIVDELDTVEDMREYALEIWRKRRGRDSTM